MVAPYGASQEFFLTQALTSWKFDDKRISEEEAATIPVTLCTAADALYNKMDPVLPLPGTGEVCGWPILIWGGSSQVGIQAIQLAKQSGCDPVITTSSPKVYPLNSKLMKAFRIFEIAGGEYRIRLQRSQNCQLSENSGWTNSPSTYL